MSNFNQIVLGDKTLEVEDTKARTDIGDVSTLETTTKENLVKAVNECFQFASDGKALIASALTGMGVTTDSDATFAEMAERIAAIETGTDTSDATATVAQILSGATAYVAGGKVTGTMANQGAVTSALNAGGSYTIPAGYHNGSGKVTANSLASQTAGTATAAQILSGLTAWVGGSKITGTMENLTAKSTIEFASGNGTKVIETEVAYYQTNTDNVTRVLLCYAGAGGYISNNTLFGISASRLASAFGITADKIVAGNTILGVVGTGYGTWA